MGQSDTDERVLRLRLRIEGRVQGVYYRASVQRQAIALDLSGWVRNLPDGAVEAAVQGAAEKVEALVAYCEDGPPMARVSRILRAEEPLEEDGPFEVRY
ncbi:MAG: acylphosphatase [Planctomycetota bacterium]